MTLDKKNNANKYWSFESTRSFRRPEAIDQYNTYKDTGYEVIVSCPSFSFTALKNILKQRGREGIVAMTIESMGIMIGSAPPKLIHRDDVPDKRPMAVYGRK